MHYKFQIFGVPVFGRTLPSGDLAIWHPYNCRVQEIVEPICRNHGHWRSSHNNWIVFGEFAEWTLEELRRAGGEHA